MSVAILSDALTRTFFIAPIYGLSDLMEVIAPVIVASCFPVTLASTQDISIRFLGRSLPVRPGQLLELFCQTAALLVVAGIVWEVGRYTKGLIYRGQFAWLLGIPIWPSWIVSTALFMLCLPIQAIVVTRVFRKFKSSRPLSGSEADFFDHFEESRQ